MPLSAGTGGVERERERESGPNRSQAMHYKGNREGRGGAARGLEEGEVERGGGCIKIQHCKSGPEDSSLFL